MLLGALGGQERWRAVTKSILGDSSRKDKRSIHSLYLPSYNCGQVVIEYTKEDIGFLKHVPFFCIIVVLCP